MAGNIGGYEVSWTCGECGNWHDLGGMSGMSPDDYATVNGEPEAFRPAYGDGIEHGNRLGCANCGTEFIIKFKRVESDS